MREKSEAVPMPVRAVFIGGWRKKTYADYALAHPATQRFITARDNGHAEPALAAIKPVIRIECPKSPLTAIRKSAFSFYIR